MEAPDGHNLAVTKWSRGGGRPGPVGRTTTPGRPVHPRCRVAQDTATGTVMVRPSFLARVVRVPVPAGTDVAIQSAGVTLIKGDLRGIAKAIRLSRATMWNIRENLLFAFLYNALGIPVAAGVLYPFFGLLLSPIIAGAAMSLSSVSVVANALRLRKARL